MFDRAESRRLHLLHCRGCSEYGGHGPILQTPRQQHDPLAPCPDCGFYRDNPAHELGCVPMRRMNGEAY